jgi:signal peptidase I
VVVFRAQAGAGSSPFLVKRIVGLPGDRVRGRDGKLWVNGVPVEQWPTGEVWIDGGGTPLSGRRESLDGHEHAVLDDPARVAAPFEGVVSAGRYFVLGDNRDHSSDSRRFGAVPFADLVGPVAFLYWSGAPDLRAAASGWEIAGLARWSRVGEGIE